MQLIELDEENIKLILNEEERRALHLKSVCGPELGEGSGREAILDLISELGERFARPSSLRLYPRGDGGCEIFVTATEIREPDTVCHLSALSHAIALRIALKRGGYRGQSRIFLGREGCFMQIKGTHAPIEGEFGTVLPLRGEEALPWLLEHCRELPDPQSGGPASPADG